MARRGSAIAGNRAVGTAPSTGSALAPATPASPLATSLATGMGVNTTGRVNQTGGWGDAYGGLALPRSPQDFTDGAFGPFSPIIPSPVDGVPEGGDFPLARREEYRVGWNLPTGQPGAEGLKLADFGTLRTLADLYSVARSCITYLKSEIASLEWDVSPTTEAAKSMRNDKAAMTDFGERRGEAVKFFRRPDPDYFSWQSWMSAVMEEMLVFDALSIVLRPKWGRGLKKGLLWSDLDSLNLISGPTVRPLYDMNGATPRPPAPAYQQYLYGVPRVDLMTMIRQRDLDDGRLRESALGAYTNSQLLYLPMQPRRWTPYGFPPIERALIPVLTGLSKQGYQLDYFKEGTVPSVYISPGGDLSPNQIRELQDALNAVAGDPAWHHKIIVLPSGSHTEPQRPTPLADMFDDIVMTQVCSAFGVQPSQIGITPRATAAAFTSSATANSAAKQNSNTQDMSTLQPTLLFLTAIMNSLLQDVCGQQDMRFVFAGMQEEEDEETTTNLLVNQVSHALITIDEARDKLGLQPYGITESTEPGFLTPTGFMFLSQPAAPELPPQMGGNDGESGGAAPPPGGKPGAPGNQPAPPPQYGPKPNGPANSTQGRPAQPPAKEPGEKSPANAAAEGTNNAKNKPDQGGAMKAATPDDTTPEQDDQPDPDAPSDTLDQVGQLALEAYIAKQVAGIVTSAWQGSISLLEAVDWIVQELASVYLKVMTAASKAAAQAVEGVVAMATGDLFALAQQRAEQQRPYSMGMVQAAVNDAAMGGTEPPAWIQGRAKLYAETLAGASNCGYGETVKTSEPQYKIFWRLGETEHCPLCLERDGNEYTFESLPGYPGDGGFGGPICLGGPNCFPEYTRVTSVDIELGYTRWYDGELVTVVTANGHELSGTPNHPVLTCSGWKPLGLLQDGDHLIGGTFVETVTADPHVHAVPTAIGQVVESLYGLGAVGPSASTYRVGIALDDFHGDGSGSSKVDVVRPDGQLPLHGNTTSGKPVRKFVLSGADVGHVALASLSHANSFDLGSVSTAPGSVGGGDLSDTLLRGHSSPLSTNNPGATLAHSSISAGSDGAPLLHSSVRVADSALFRSAPQLDTVLDENGADSGEDESQFSGHGVDGTGLVVQLDQVINVNRRPWSGHVYNLQTTSGWYIAEGIIAHNCGCHLEYHEGDRVDAMGNPHRAQMDYYAQQKKDIMARRQRMQVEREQFVAGLPNQTGTDGTSAQSRAMSRDQMRTQLADLANQRIRSNGGYPGVSVEPADIPAKLIASLIPQYGPIPATVPLTDIMDAVESMFAGKFASADTTKTAFGSLVLSAVVDTVSGWERAVASEMEACARHLDKGRAAGSWQARRIDQRDVDTLADLLQTGAVSRADAVKQALDNRRRWVDVGGQVMEPPTAIPNPAADELPPYQEFGGPVANATRTNPAGGGGYTLLPHDGDGIYHDTYDLSKGITVDLRGSTIMSDEDMDTLRAKIGKAITRTTGLTVKAASDPGDPNPVDAEHVYNQMLANYPPKAIQWIKKARWIGPMAVDPDRVDTQDEDSWAASHEPGRIKHFIKDIKKGKDIKPGVCVQEPSQETVKVIDGHHRFLAARESGEPYKAYVGFVDQDSGPWDETHSFQFHQGADPKNKSAETPELSTVHRPLGTHGLWHDKDAQLPAYIQNVAHAMIRDGHDESEAIQLAIGSVKRWAAGEGRVTPEVQAAATAALAEWEKLKVEHSKTKALDPTGETALKVGPHGYIHGWIFVGVPGVGDEVNHPSHGKGTITGHDDKHVTVHFASGKDHSFEVHRSAGEEGHFTERGKLEHGGATESPADKVWRDPKEIENLSNNDLESARQGLLKHHEQIGAWGPDADRMDDIRSKVQREIYDREDAKRNAVSYGSAERGPATVGGALDEDLQLVVRDRERQAREQGMDPDRMRGYRAARVELARRADRDPENWTTDKLHIFGGTPKQQLQVQDTMKTLMSDIPPERAAKLRHIEITDSGMGEITEANYSFGPHIMRVNPKTLDAGSSSLQHEASGWYSKSGHPTTLQRALDHEFGHHLDSLNMVTEGGSWDTDGLKNRGKMYSHLSEAIGNTMSDFPSDPGAHISDTDDFVKKNKAEIVNNVGTYASTNNYELIAELWTQYHGQKLNGEQPTEQYSRAASEMVAHHLAGFSTPATRNSRIE